MSVTPSQMKTLLEFMEDHPDIAKNYVPKSTGGKKELNKLWTDLAARLNTELPNKSVTAWRKVWTDVKYRTKKKLNQSKMSMSEYEEKVVQLTSARTAEAGSNSSCFGGEQYDECVIDDLEIKMEDLHNGFQLTYEQLPKSRPTTSTPADNNVSPKPIPTHIFQSSPAKKRRVQENLDSTEILTDQTSTDKNFQENLLKLLKERNRQDLEFHQKMLSQQEKMISLLEVVARQITEK